MPPAITLVNSQLRSETLHLYYSENIFECWRPFLWQHDWSLSTLVFWLSTLGPEKISWINCLILLYKNEDELEYDFEETLSENGFNFQTGVLSYRQELSEYEMQHEQLGLPKSFGEKRHSRWMYSSS